MCTYASRPLGQTGSRMEVSQQIFIARRRQTKVRDKRMTSGGAVKCRLPSKAEQVTKWALTHTDRHRHKRRVRRQLARLGRLGPLFTLLKDSEERRIRAGHGWARFNSCQLWWGDRSGTGQSCVGERRPTRSSAPRHPAAGRERRLTGRRGTTAQPATIGAAI